MVVAELMADAGEAVGAELERPSAGQVIRHDGDELGCQAAWSGATADGVAAARRPLRCGTTWTSPVRVAAPAGALSVIAATPVGFAAVFPVGAPPAADGPTDVAAVRITCTLGAAKVTSGPGG